MVGYRNFELIIAKLSLAEKGSGTKITLTCYKGLAITLTLIGLGGFFTDLFVNLRASTLSIIPFFVLLVPSIAILWLGYGLLPEADQPQLKNWLKVVLGPLSK